MCFQEVCKLHRGCKIILQEGLSKIGPLADRTAHFNALLSAEKKAKELKKNLWKDYMAPTQEESEGTLDEVSEGENTQSSDKTTDLQEVHTVMFQPYDY